MCEIGRVLDADTNIHNIENYTYRKAHLLFTRKYNERTGNERTKQKQKESATKILL